MDTPESSANPHGRHVRETHEHGPGHGADADWDSLADQIELEGELLLAFVTDTARRIAELRGPDAPPIRRVLDIGSGPGVGTCELAQQFPDARVVAVDGSPAMLERARRRAATRGFEGRVTTRLAELPDGLDGLGPADVIWASMALHHVGDETGALRTLRDRLVPSGLLALAEMAEPTGVLPDDLDVGRPGLADRLRGAESTWFAAMRAGLPGSVPSTDVVAMVGAAGYDVLDARLTRQRFDPPLSETARQFVLSRVRRTAHQLDESIDRDDRLALAVLSDPDDPRGVMHRGDVFIESSREIVIARPRPDP